MSTDAAKCSYTYDFPEKGLPAVIYHDPEVYWYACTLPIYCVLPPVYLGEPTIKRVPSPERAKE
jgi:hypothetical protein